MAELTISQAAELLDTTTIALMASLEDKEPFLLSSFKCVAHCPNVLEAYVDIQDSIPINYIEVAECDPRGLIMSGLIRACARMIGKLESAQNELLQMKRVREDRIRAQAEKTAKKIEESIIR
jgi:hypothetical protein